MLKRTGLVVGATLFIALLLLPAPAGLSMGGWRILAVVALMSVWWSTEAVPIAVTAVLPFLIFPMTGAMPAQDVAASYMGPPIFFVLGGTMLGLTVERWGLHRRIARAILARTAGKPSMLLLGLMVATAILAAIVHNTTAMLIVLPVAAAVIALMDDAAPDLEQDRKAFAAAAVLATLYGAMIGGFSTILGSPVNPLLAGMISKAFGIELGFVGWATFGVPLALVTLPIAWFILTRLAFRIQLPDITAEALHGALGERKAWTAAEWRTTVVGLGAALGWIAPAFLGGKFLPTGDAGVAMLALLALCIIPSGTTSEDGAPQRLLDWPQVRSAPWHILFLFGGGMALAAGIGQTDLGAWLAGKVGGMTVLPFWLMLVLFALALIAITEWMSNFAMYAAFMPVAAALSAGNIHLSLALGMVVAFASNWSFIMPVATIPNALAIGTGHVRVPDLMRSGFYMDIAGAVAIGVVCGVITAVY